MAIGSVRRGLRKRLRSRKRLRPNSLWSLGSTAQHNRASGDEPFSPVGILQLLFEWGFRIFSLREKPIHQTWVCECQELVIIIWSLYMGWCKGIKYGIHSFTTSSLWSVWQRRLVYWKTRLWNSRTSKSMNKAAKCKIKSAKVQSRTARKSKI